MARFRARVPRAGTVDVKRLIYYTLCTERIDAVGKLRVTPRGNCHLLTIQCNLTKYLIAIPIPNIKAMTIADCLAKYLIWQFGASRVMLSTRSGYRPQINVFLECSHAPLMDFIRAFSESSITGTVWLHSPRSHIIPASMLALTLSPSS